MKPSVNFLKQFYTKEEGKIMDLEMDKQDMRQHELEEFTLLNQNAPSSNAQQKLKFQQ